MSYKVLLVEDDPYLSDIYLTYFKHEGFDISHAEDGKKCLSMLEKENFDILILDLLLPEIDGFEVLKKIKERNIKIHTIVLSNLNAEEYFKKAKELGAEEYLLKTKYMPKELVEKVKKICKNIEKNRQKN